MPGKQDSSYVTPCEEVCQQSALSKAGECQTQRFTLVHSPMDGVLQPSHNGAKSCFIEV